MAIKVVTVMRQSKVMIHENLQVMIYMIELDTNSADKIHISFEEYVCVY